MMHRSSHALLFLGAALTAIVLTADPSTAQTPGLRLTLQEALSLAERRSPEMALADIQINAAQAQVVGAAGRMLPTVGFSGLWNFAEKLQTIPNPFASLGGPSELTLDFTQDFMGSVDLRLPMWTWGAHVAGYQEARTGLQAAYSQKQTRQQEVMLNVTRAFYGVLLAKQGVDVAGEALQQAERHEEVAAERFRQGAVSEFEWLRARVQAANLRPGLTRAEAMFRQARISLNLAIGLDPDTDLQAQGELTYVPVAVELPELRTWALANRSDLHGARLGIQQAELGVRMVRASRLPALMMSGSYGFRSDNVWLSERFNDNYAFNMVVAFPLFDGFATQSRRQLSLAGLQQSRLAADQLERFIRAEVDQAFHDLRSAEQSLLAQRDNVGQAERAVEIAQVSYENGMITGIELMDSQFALMVARQNESQTLYDYRVALARIEKAIGRPLTP